MSDFGELAQAGPFDQIMNLVEGAVAILTQVATFEEAAVAGSDK